MRFAISLLAILSAAVAAQAADDVIPDPGVRYRVVDVAQNDRLNVRAQPGIQAPVVGTLRPGVTDVGVTGLRQEVEGATWWEVLDPAAQQGSGWVNAHFLAAQGAAADTDYALQCSGTEPFWSLTVRAGAARFSRAGSRGPRLSASAWRPAEGRRGQYAIRLRSDHDTGALVVLRNASCSDGMSDRLYPFTGVAVLPDGRVFGGCCRRAAP